MAEWRTAKEQVAVETDALAEARYEQSNLEDAQRILQVVAQGIQQQAHEQINLIVSQCLQTIFDDPYQFRITFEKKRGKTEARISLVRDGVEVDPLRGSGGGVVDVIAFALRLACLVLQRPPIRRLLVLDEPFKHLSRNHGERVRKLLMTLSKQLGVQIVMVTHSPQLAIGKVIELNTKGGE